MADYDPLRYRKDYSGIERAGAIIGGTIASIPELKANAERDAESKKLREEAIADAKKDWSEIETSYKYIKKDYARRAQAAGYTPEEIQSNLMRLRVPTKSDKKDIGGYIDNLGKEYGTLLGDIQRRQEGQSARSAIYGGAQPGEATGPVTASMDRQPGEAPEVVTEQDITSREIRPPATDKREAFGRMLEDQPGMDPKSAKGYLETAGFEDPEKQSKIDRRKAMTEAEEWRKQVAFGKLAIQEAKKTGDHKQVQIAEDNAKTKILGHVGRRKKRIDDLKDQVKQLKAGKENPLTRQIEPPTEEDIKSIEDLYAEIEVVNGEITELKNEQKMIGALPGENREFVSGESKQIKSSLGNKPPSPQAGPSAPSAPIQTRTPAPAPQPKLPTTDSVKKATNIQPRKLSEWKQQALKKYGNNQEKINKYFKWLESKGLISG